MGGKMRRILATAVLVAFAIMPLYGVAVADPLHAITNAFAAQSDLRAAFAMRTFGRVPTTDDAAFSVPAGIRSPLRGLQFSMSVQPQLVARTGAPLLALPQIPQISLAFNRVFNLTDAISRYDNLDAIAAPAPVTVTNASVLQSPAVAPMLSLSSTFAQPASTVAFDDTMPAFDASLQDASIAVSTPLRAGVLATTDELRAQFDDQRTHEDRLLASTTFSPSIRGYVVHVNLGTDYTRLSNGNSGTMSFVPSTTGADIDSSAAEYLPGGSATLASNLTDVTTHGVNAGVALPITRDVTFGMQYGTQRYTGLYSPAFEPTLDASQYQYLGNVTFKLPRSSSAITLSAQQYRYQDNITPTNTYTGTRADLNFSVKF
jgi:hypothetical protein